MSIEQVQSIGIIGGGQLGRMMTTEAIRMGMSVRVIDPTEPALAAQVGAEQIVAPLTDEAATRKLASLSDVMTFEIEHINTEVLMDLQEAGVPIHPLPETLATIKDKVLQKEFLREGHLPVTDFMPVTSTADVENVIKAYGFPFLLKSQFGGYDGRGNALVTSEDDVEKAIKKLGNQPIYAERYVPFVKELAIMVARGRNGDILTYPVVETIHKNNICHMVLAPAPVDANIYQQAEELGKATMEQLGGSGVFGIEMFVTEDGQVMINEIAPRVHNSGHYTIEANDTSQFEQHVRAISGLPLGSTEMKTKAAVMVNILGERKGEAQVSGLNEALALSGVHVHIYGKAETKPERKMGHITACAETLDEAMSHAQAARSAITI